MDSKKECAGNSDTFSECTEALDFVLSTTLGMTEKLHSPEMTEKLRSPEITAENERCFRMTEVQGFED